MSGGSQRRDAKQIAAAMRGPVTLKFVESGEKDRLKEILRAKLTECGWRDDMRAYCKTQIEQKGSDNISLEWLVSQVSPHGKATVPASVKADMLVRIRKFLAANATLPTPKDKT
ncbi:enhancer-yellow 2 transcription factor [Pelomyxa schiedti]|nr:enhancer-yellow 2 transcription factor [Pelomyxa schiedti]